MGRRKIAIKPLSDERNRSVTFLKRKAGLFKKAHELAVLCSIDISVIIFGTNKKLYEFSSIDTKEIIERYKATTPHEIKRPSDFNKGLASDDEDDEGTPANSTAASPQPSVVGLAGGGGGGGHHSRTNSRQTTSPPLRAAAAAAGHKKKKSNASTSSNHSHTRTQSNPIIKKEPTPPPQSYDEHQQQVHHQHLHQQRQQASQTVPPPSTQTHVHHAPPQHQYYIDQQQRRSNSVAANYQQVPAPVPAHLQQQHQQQQQQQQQEYNQQFGLPPRSQSVDITSDPRFQAAQRFPNPTNNVQNMRPKLKVQIPSESEDARVKDDKNDKDQSTSGGSGGGNVHSGGSNGSFGIGQPRSGPNSAGANGPSNSLTLPPPSPSNYLANQSGVGPGNPFGRPSLANANNGEQTPSRYMNDLLPSPSGYYGSDWSFPYSGFPQSATQTQPPTAIQPQGQQQQQQQQQPQQPQYNQSGPPPSAINRMGHLSNDILPSPLQFSPINGNTNNGDQMSQNQQDQQNKSPNRNTNIKREGDETTGSVPKKLRLGS